MVEPITPTDTPQDPVVPAVDPAAVPAVDPTPTDPAPADPALADPEEGTLLGKKGDAEPKDPGKNDDGTDATDKPIEGVPEKYDLKMGEGVELDQETLELFTPIFKELGLENEGVQKLADVYVPLAQNIEEQVRQKSLEEFSEMKKEWKAETLNQLGADSDKQLAVCAKAIDTFGGGDEARELLDQTGIGNHPVFVRMMINAGNTIKEDTFIEPKVPTLPGQTPDEQLKKLYPTMNKT